ncbi:MAG: LuxR C-terminal-related transcriptional regulator [Propionibacteriales bacterium]|nr:LuxR C-terminal-related transcriptional regulator [Propionibacteriales bacterium]
MTLELSYIAATSRVDLLTHRERAVLQKIALGQSDAAISAQLGLPLGEVTSLVAGIFDKLGLVPTPYLSRRVLAALTLRQARRPQHVPRPRPRPGEVATP